MNKAVGILVLLLLSACMGEIPSSPVQEWEGLEFRIETRPPFISPGMTEFLVVANRPGRKPASALLVELRVGPTGRWVQAIEDGNVGVYRRAMRVGNPETEILYVHLRNKEKKEGLLEFPLSYGVKK